MPTSFQTAAERNSPRTFRQRGIFVPRRWLDRAVSKRGAELEAHTVAR